MSRSRQKPKPGGVPPTRGPDETRRPGGSILVLGLLLLASVIWVYFDTPGAGFLVHHDDDDYVTRNPSVTCGLTWEGIAFAFTRSHAANWHPLTWISHQADVTLFGMDPRGHHLTSILLHALNTLLLFLVLRRMTGAAGRSACVAALFAVHPLHVESVAWIAERKDVLSCFFLLLTLLAYAGYARRPSGGRYALVAALFALGLLAKPMLVTLPFLLLLLDFWPLQRARGGWTGPAGWRRLLLEKVPLLVLSAGSCIVTLIAQGEGGALQNLPLGERLSNAAVSYVQYLAKTAWPSGLAAIYPHPEGALPLWYAAAAAAFLAGVTCVAFFLGRKAPYLIVGWLWYLGALVPVIGIVQVGLQARADRYTYIPLIGIFVAVAWGAWQAASALPSRLARGAGQALPVLAFAILVALAIAAHRQAAYWKDSITLFERALAVTKDNYLAEHDLGMALVLSGRYKEGALQHLERAVAIKPDFGVGYADLASVHLALGHKEEARRYVDLCRRSGLEPPPSLVKEL